MSDSPGFALYVHWPFCQSKCPYCDFNSHIRETIDEAAWQRALLIELDHFAAETPGRRLGSIFFGGGTPSLMPPRLVAAIIDRAMARWPAAGDVEITLEANPGSADAGRFAGYATAGVNRVSLGVQALDDTALAFLGRRHSAREALDAVALAARHFGRFSFDLIYARPGQTPDNWASELTRALDHAGEHLSVYQLTIEEGTRFFALAASGALVPPAEEVQAELYEATQAILEAAGRPAYEISNHARPGAESRHNLTYWRSGDHVGIGPGAHGRLTLDGVRWATRTHRAPEIWLERTLAHGHAEHPRERVAPEAHAEEMLMMGLRLVEGVEIARLEAATGLPLDRIAPPERRGRLVRHGFITEAGGRLRTTAAGRQRLNAVLAALVA